MRLLRRKEVETLTALSKSALYSMMAEGAFPRPVRVGPHAVRWRWEDVMAWIEACPVADRV